MERRNEPATFVPPRRRGESSHAAAAQLVAGGGGPPPRSALCVMALRVVRAVTRHTRPHARMFVCVAAKWGVARRRVTLCHAAMRGQADVLANRRLANGQSLGAHGSGSRGQTVGNPSCTGGLAANGECCTTRTTEPRQTGSPAVTVQRRDAPRSAGIERVVLVAQCTVGPVLRAVVPPGRGPGRARCVKHCRGTKRASEKDASAETCDLRPARVPRVPWPAPSLGGGMSGLGRNGF